MRKRRYWGKSPKRFGKCYAGFITMVILLFALLFLIEVQIRPIAEAIAVQRAHLAVVGLINESVYDQLGQGISYQQLITIHKDDAGNIVLIQPDTIKISQFSTAIAQELEEKIGDLSKEGVKIPIGLLSGLTLIADKGPMLTIPVQPMGQVSVSVRDEFVAAGINQTKHQVILDISVSLNILIPFDPKMTQIQNSLPMVESIIVGPIPDTYLNWQSGGQGLEGLQNFQSTTL